MNDNTIFRATSYQQKHKHIIYEPKYSFLDTILYLSDDMYFVLDSSYDTHNSNTLPLLDSNIGLYSYHCVVTHNIEKHLNDPLAAAMHLPLMIIVDQIKTYKKEDKHIIQNKLNHATLLFTNEKSYNYFAYSDKCILLPIGIPVDNIPFQDNFDTRQDILIIDSGPVTQQLKAGLEQSGLSCALMKASLNLETASYLMNKYKVCIDLSDNHEINLHIAACCGCHTITSKALNSQHTSNIIQYVEPNTHMLDPILAALKKSHNNTEVREYISQHYNYNIFLDKYRNIINQISHEVYIR